MSEQIIRQPDGLFAVFSTVTDTLIIVDATAQELEDHYAERAADEARRRVSRLTGLVGAGKAREAYYQFAMTMDEAIEKSRQHGGDLEPRGGND